MCTALFGVFVDRAAFNTGMLFQVNDPEREVTRCHKGGYFGGNFHRTCLKICIYKWMNQLPLPTENRTLITKKTFSWSRGPDKIANFENNILRMP